MKLIAHYIKGDVKKEHFASALESKEFLTLQVIEPGLFRI